MPRYALQISYHGARYGGWQDQPNAPTVQAEVNRALSTLLRTPAACTGSGRTDAGVHASGQVAHFDFGGALPQRFLVGINGILPPDIAVHAVYQAADPAFHARFSAISRAYTYQIVTRKSPLLEGLAMRIPYMPDLARLEEAASLLFAYEDFESFCKAHTDNTHFRCRILEARWELLPDRLCFHIRANRFLRGMVRAITGTLLLAGQGVLSLEEVRRIIEARDRRAAPANADAQGLCLTDVQYPEGMLVRASLS
ncbi:MAG: tRNA pseudouridine(38-40) synthase TruA [Bacteroidia bacterium]|nr:tRNA pseudouridine(38-40) synthase TruA [Bacteroidia bacterium]